ncbi:MbcA/ParS/Xre antitoxin family protein [Aeromonas caviae]
MIYYSEQLFRGLGGVAPATLLTTQMGVQAVIDLVGRIQHGVCI